MRDGKYAEAEGILLRVVERLGCDDQVSIGPLVIAHALLSRASMLLGNEQSALSHYDKACSLMDQVPTDSGGSQARYLGLSANALGLYEKAFEHYQCALDAHDSLMQSLPVDQAQMMVVLGVPTADFDFGKAGAFKEIEKEIITEYLDVTRKVGNSEIEQKLELRLAVLSGSPTS